MGLENIDNYEYSVQNDEPLSVNKKPKIMWDKKKSKYINKPSNDDVKYITSESGHRIPSSYKSGM